MRYFGLDNLKSLLEETSLEAWWMFEQRARALYIITVLTSSKAHSACLYCVFSLSAVLYLSCHLDLNQGWKASVRVGNIPTHLSLSPSQSKGCLAEDCGNSCLLISIATLTWEKLVLFHPLKFLTKLDCQWLCQWTLCVGVCVILPTWLRFSLPIANNPSCLFGSLVVSIATKVQEGAFLCWA